MRLTLLALALLLPVTPAVAETKPNTVYWNGAPLAVTGGTVPTVKGNGTPKSNPKPAAKPTAQPTAKPAATSRTADTLLMPRPSLIVDDAPPPKKAPPRKNVDIASLPAPFGLMEAAAAPPRPRYAPALLARSNLPQIMKVKPGAKPSAPADANFTLTFSRLQIDVSDALTRWQNAALPVSLGPNLALFLQAVALSAQKNPTARVELRAYAGQGGWQSESRRHAMTRALAVYQWLVDQGVRPTQIDWYALGLPEDGGNADRVDISLKTP